MVTRLQSGTCSYLGGVRVCSGNYWERDGRLTAKVALPDEDLILGVGDEFLIGETRYRVKAIEEGDGGDYLVIDDFSEGLIEELSQEEKGKEEASKRRLEWRKMVKDHTFKIPRRGYLELLEELRQLTPHVLEKLATGAANFTILRWENEMKSEMERNLKEGDMGPNTTEVNQAVFSEIGAQAFTTVNITRWSPDHIANMSAGAEWSVNGERIFCSLHCEADGEVYQACVMGPSLALEYVREFLLSNV